MAGINTSRRGLESKKWGASIQDGVEELPSKKLKSRKSSTGSSFVGAEIIETKAAEAQIAPYTLRMSTLTYRTRLHNIGIFMHDDKITF